MRRLALFLLIAVVWSGEATTPATAATPTAAELAAQVGVELRSDLAYRDAGQDDYVRQQCQLDLYLPAQRQAPVPVLVWFHGGGLEGGNKTDKGTAALCRAYAAAGVAVASANYRLSPKVQAPVYIQDAATAVAWAVAHAGGFGGDGRAVFIGGHSAGGYLAAMLAAEPAYLRDAGVKPEQVAGVIPVSGQVFTHFTIRKERGVADPQNTPVVDDMAPCWHVAKAKAMPPLLLICGDKDWVARTDENRYFLTMLKALGARDAAYLEVADRTHGSIIGRMPDPADPARQAILAFVERLRPR